jgi:hypothetical protein
MYFGHQIRARYAWRPFVANRTDSSCPKKAQRLPELEQEATARLGL